MNWAPALFALAAFCGGLLVAAQGPIYARLSEALDRQILPAVFLAFTVATLATGLMVLASGNLRSLDPARLAALPPWVWLGGIFGACHVAISMQAIPVLGVTAFLVIVVTGNLFGAALYDHFGAFGLTVRPMSWLRAFGLTLVVAGVAISLRG